MAALLPIVPAMIRASESEEEMVTLASQTFWKSDARFFAASFTAMLSLSLMQIENDSFA
jgi:hypothetical protein